MNTDDIFLKKYVIRFSCKQRLFYTAQRCDSSEIHLIMMQAHSTIYNLSHNYVK